MKEGNISRLIQMEASRLGMRLFKNVRGLFYAADGTPVRAGLDVEHSADLIGIVTVTVTADMVGKKLGVFVAAEVKRPEFKKPRNDHEKQQQLFLTFINNCGGMGFFITSPDDLKRLVDERLKTY